MRFVSGMATSWRRFRRRLHSSTDPKSVKWVRCRSQKCGYVFAVHNGGKHHGMWQGPFIPYDGGNVCIMFTFGDYDDSCVGYHEPSDVPEMWGDCKWDVIKETELR